MSIMTNMIDAMLERDIEAYLPGRHSGACLQPYAVVADDGVRKAGKTTGRHVYLVTAYVPVARPTAIGPLLAAIKSALATVDNVRETGDQSPDGIDDELQAYYVTLEYSALCSLI